MSRNPPRNGPPVGVFVDRCKAVVGALPASRRRFAGWMRSAALNDEVTGELEIVFSELTANAVAGSSATSAHIDVRAEIDDGMLVLDVSNEIDDPDGWRAPVPAVDDPLRRSGRGLLITRALMHSVDMQIEHLNRLVVHSCRRVSPARSC